MQQLSPTTFRLNWMLVGNVYLVVGDDGLTLIDASVTPSGPMIMRELRGAGYGPRDLRRILITHAHPDHVGGLTHLVAQTGAEVWASELEKPVIEGRMPIPMPDPATLKFIGRMMRPSDTTLKAVTVDRVIQPGEQLDIVAPGFEVVATPGHAPGHIAFWHPTDRALFGGDVVFNLFGLRLPPTGLTVDMAENRRSLSRLLALDPLVAGFGHGVPLHGTVREQLRSFARSIGVADPQAAAQ